MRREGGSDRSVDGVEIGACERLDDGWGTTARNVALTQINIIIKC
jgi:hypothetical protein